MRPRTEPWSTLLIQWWTRLRTSCRCSRKQPWICVMPRRPASVCSNRPMRARKSSAGVPWRGPTRPNLGGMTPRNFSPCGTVLDRRAPQLFSNPALHFAYLDEVFPSLTECLLIPFFVGGRPVGTIWAMTFDDVRTFDAEDVRILTSLGEFAATALQVVSALDSAHQQIAERRRAEEVLEARVRQQAAVAELGQRALHGHRAGHPDGRGHHRWSPGASRWNTATSSSSSPMGRRCCCGRARGGVRGSWATPS